MRLLISVALVLAPIYDCRQAEVASEATPCPECPTREVGE